MTDKELKAFNAGKAYGATLVHALVSKGLSYDENQWITVHPNGKHHKGQPALIDQESKTVIAGGLMFRGAALNHCSINENYPVCEDFDFHLQLLRLGKIYSIQEPLYLYRAHGSNLGRRWFKPRSPLVQTSGADGSNLGRCLFKPRPQMVQTSTADGSNLGRRWFKP